VTGTLEEAGLPSGRFDAVALWDCLEHLEDPLGTLHEVHRILCERGICLVMTPTTDSLIHRLGTFLYALSLGTFRKTVELLYDCHHNYYFSDSNLSQMLAGAGFSTIMSIDLFGAHISRWQTVPIPCWMEIGTNVLDQVARLLAWDYRVLVCAARD
jgi:2-polyprenyl-3-methyl-5-hydroxy-6-metoxy-1,4-benzoquinol methylase